MISRLLLSLLCSHYHTVLSPSRTDRVAVVILLLFLFKKYIDMLFGNLNSAYMNEKKYKRKMHIPKRIVFVFCITVRVVSTG